MKPCPVGGVITEGHVYVGGVLVRSHLANHKYLVAWDVEVKMIILVFHQCLDIVDLFTDPLTLQVLCIEGVPIARL